MSERFYLKSQGGIWGVFDSHLSKPHSRIAEIPDWVWNAESKANLIVSALNACDGVDVDSLCPRIIKTLQSENSRLSVIIKQNG